MPYIFKLVIGIILFGHATLSEETVVKRDTTLANQINGANHSRDLSAQGRMGSITKMDEDRSLCIVVYKRYASLVSRDCSAPLERDWPREDEG